MNERTKVKNNELDDYLLDKVYNDIKGLGCPPSDKKSIIQWKSGLDKIFDSYFPDDTHSELSDQN